MAEENKDTQTTTAEGTPKPDETKTGEEKVSEETPPAEQKTEEKAEGQKGQEGKEASPEGKKEGEGEKEPDAPKTPEKYDLKLPEGSLLDQARVEKIAAYAREQGFSQEQAQAIVEQESQAIKEYTDGAVEKMNQQAAAWIEEAKKDPEIGGEKFNGSLEHSKRLLEKYAPPEFRDLLDETGYGNHPLVLKTFARIGKAMAEDKLVHGSGASGAKKSLAERLYGDVIKK